ncbi:hypothetical protein GGS23DRAFT_617360 [Durotheca rogersii]|uniref:uncharacterized protein n=1 Tax=Durotheca rogersii TaxID=419775 RepID=UPI00222038EA|nr:uncharacterized protein GGS23DRAFT_617360 [Durotheca rogersii]KAI5866297.1 hypothetical protein GGS23DRAFT_617360 [Durotheca rogersii]
MAGYVLEIKRNYECSTDKDLKALVLGDVDAANVHESTSDASVEDYTPRSVLERHIATVNTKRCQEWTMEVLAHLVKENLIHEDAVNIVQAERDPPTHGIFGYR